ncbi:stress responsive protein [Croceivirga lutea]|nr:stress responsive protein [Croceivirga lutea]
MFTNSANKEAMKTIKSDKTLRHVVLFKFKKSATDANIKAIEESFEGLPSKIKEIKDFEWGTNNSPEGLSKGFTHCFFVTFENEEGRSTYLPHKAHKAFTELASPHIEDVLVIDYWKE